MFRSILRQVALASLFALLPASALAARQTITLGSGNPANVYQDADGANRDASVKVTRYQEWPPAYYNGWTAADYAWPSGQRPGLVTEDAYAVGWLGWAWIQIPPGAGWDWISWYPNPYSPGMSYYFDVDRSGPYHADYDVSFTMPAHFVNATVEIQYMADDWMNAYMNGQIFVDEHGPVIAYYFDGVPPPAGLCGFGCIGTTTVADAAQFLVAGANTFTVRQWEPDQIGGVAFLVRISYDDTMEVLLATLHDLSAAVAALPSGAFNNANQQSALARSLEAEVNLVEGGLYLEARDKMAGGILARMDGFATAGAPDANDWIRTAAGQNATYPLGAKALQLLDSLL